MNRFGIVLGVLSALAIGGCDDGPSFDVTEEPAGANCLTGGFRIEADGAVFYSCNGQAATETVAAGAEGNPCAGPALRVTVPMEDGTTAFAYACQPVEIDPLAAELFSRQFDYAAAEAPLGCACEEDPDAQAECESQLPLIDTIRRVADRCIGGVLAVAGDMPEADRPAIECVVDLLPMVIDCMEAIPTNECSAETEAAAAACRENGVEESCPMSSSDLAAWLTKVRLVGQFLGCPISGAV